MKIAITYDEGKVFQHFGHTENFKIYCVEGDKITSSEIVASNGAGHGALATLLDEEKVDVLICGGIGAGAQNALASVGIKLYGGVQGDCDEVVAAFLEGKLDYNPDVKCNQHHHGEEGNCTNGGCGGNCKH